MSINAAAGYEFTGAEAIAACLMVEHGVGGTVVTINLDRFEVGLCKCGDTGHVRLVSRQVSGAARELAGEFAKKLEIDAGVLDRALAVGQRACARAMARYVRSGNDIDCLELEDGTSLSCSKLLSAFDSTLGQAIDELLITARTLLESHAMSMGEATFGLAGRMAGVLCMRRIREHEGSEYGIPDVRFPQNPGREDLGGVVERGAGYITEGRVQVGALVDHEIDLVLCELEDGEVSQGVTVRLAHATDSLENLANGPVVGPVLINREMPVVLVDGKEFKHELAPEEVSHLLWHVGDGPDTRSIDGAFSAVTLRAVDDRGAVALQVDLVSSSIPQRYGVQKMRDGVVPKGLVGPATPTSVRIQLIDGGK